MIYSKEVEEMCPVAKGVDHGPAPIPEEGKWVKSKEIKDISGLTHGIGWCAPQQGACKLTLNVKEGIIQEALVETIGCSGMTHSAAMAGEILVGKTILEALNTDLVCDAINTAMRELFLQIVYGRSQSAFSEGGLSIGAGLEDLGKGHRSQVGTTYSTLAKGPRYLEVAEGYVTEIGLDANNEIIGYKYVNLGKMMENIKKGMEPLEAIERSDEVIFVRAKQIQREAIDTQLAYHLAKKHPGFMSLFMLSSLGGGYSTNIDFIHFSDFYMSKFCVYHDDEKESEKLCTSYIQWMNKKFPTYKADFNAYCDKLQAEIAEEDKTL